MKSLSSKVPYKRTMPHSRHIKRIFLLLAMLWLVLPTKAITSKDANECYRKGNYQQAIIDYKKLLTHGVSAELYYNLGNAYYRSDSLSQAILSYERALQLSPGNENIRFNLEFSRSKTIDKIVPESEMFYVTWYKSIRNLMSVDHWAYMGLSFIGLAMFFMLIYLFASSPGLRKLGFFCGTSLFLFFTISTLFAYQQKVAIENNRGAIIMVPSVNVKKAPVFNGGDSFVLHEGTRVDITDDEIKGWKGIHVADGRSGWIQANKLEKI